MELTRGGSAGLDMGGWAELSAFGSPLRLASTSPGRRRGWADVRHGGISILYETSRELANGETLGGCLPPYASLGIQDEPPSRGATSAKTRMKFSPMICSVSS
jgi:hypothetical protein